MNGRRIYVASSWRNEYQPAVVKALRAAGHEVYDFRQPVEGDNGFHWSEIDPDWQGWSVTEYADALNHPIAVNGFTLDYEAMCWANTCVVVLPCGRSAHLEAGWFTGRDCDVYFLIPDAIEPELMYKLGHAVFGSATALLERLEVQCN